MQIITDYCAMRNARALSACEMHTGPIKCRLECVFIILVLFIIPVSHIQLHNVTSLITNICVYMVASWSHLVLSPVQFVFG